jgi:hypothetical protein
LATAACGGQPGPAALDADPPDGATDVAAAAVPAVATLSFDREGRSTSFRGDHDILATCAGGHRGFEAERQGERFALNAFVAGPGVYRCDDPRPFIMFLFVPRGLHGEYGISAVEPGGSCTLRVTSLRPRFTGTFEATLARRSGFGPSEVELRHGRFDLPFPASPECP